MNLTEPPLREGLLLRCRSAKAPQAGVRHGDIP